MKIKTRRETVTNILLLAIEKVNVKCYAGSYCTKTVHIVDVISHVIICVFGI